ncbi:hypothetical protein BGZ99_005145 [Dissophora globulifera]|uniref:WSC domain-containing protein n=1 Tax=Dissophora globulifera TaxID=979702 RepID=A0A9P6UTU3_9FUNG|nr:hypothetical protein BGZ99_005145 [Dissophora globulifera]
MSQGACSAYCKVRQYQFAITQGGTTCFCSNGPLQDINKVDDSYCDKPCVGYPLETCGSGYQGLGLGSSSGSGAYANVMLVGNPLSMPAQADRSASLSSSPTPSSSTSSSSSFSSSPTEAPSEHSNESLTPPSAPTLLASASATMFSVTSRTKLQPEARNISGERYDTKRSRSDKKDDNGQDEGEDISDGETQPGNNEKDDVEEEVDDEDSDGDGDQDAGSDTSGQIITSDGPSSSAPGIPVASTVVAVVCLLGICSFVVHLARKRKRARARAAWVDSVFGADSIGRHGHHYRAGARVASETVSKRNTAMAHMSYSAHRQEDLESLSDGQSEMMERQPSISVAGTRRSSILAQDVCSRDLRASVVMPAAVRNSRRGHPTRTYSKTFQSLAGYPHRASSRLDHANNSMFHPESNNEFYNQNDDSEESEPAYLKNEYSPTTPTVITSPAHVFAPTSQRPGALIYTDNNNALGQQRRVSYGPAVSMRSAPTSAPPLHPHQHAYNHQICSEDSMFYPSRRPTLMDPPPPPIQRRRQSYQPVRSSSPTSLFDDEYDDPFRDEVAQYAYLDPQPQLRPRPRPRSQHAVVSHRHSTCLYPVPTTSSTSPCLCGVAATSTTAREARHRPVDSQYRRPHSFTVVPSQGGAGRRDSDEEPFAFRTHVLDENIDTDSIHSQFGLMNGRKYSTATRRLTSSGTVAALHGKWTGTLKKQFKRLSSPYVQAIRQQQQDHAGNSLSNMEEGGLEYLGDRSAGSTRGLYEDGGSGAVCNRFVAESGSAPSSAERRWGRGLLKGVVFSDSGIGGGDGDRSSNSNNSSNREELMTAIEEMVGVEAEGRVAAQRQSMGPGHRQVDSGSLASFRGLGNPVHPQLRVMNPDDGSVRDSE